MIIVGNVKPTCDGKEVTDPSEKVVVNVVHVPITMSVVQGGNVMVVVVDNGSGGQTRVQPGMPVTTGVASAQIVGSMYP